MTNLESHGGEIDAAAERYEIPRDHWLDLSTGINPNAYPLPELAAAYWQQLPDSGLYDWLKESAAAYYGVSDPAFVVPAPGTQAVIQWLPRTFAPTVVAVLGPTYREHAASWTAAGHAVVQVTTLADLPAQAKVVVVVNPNNPDGRVIEPEQLIRIAGDRLLVVDEAFADVVPEASLHSHVGRVDLVILRSFGKFFGLAGLRLGFALATGTLAERLLRALGPWAVSGPAAAIGAVALADGAWLRATRVRLTAAAGRLDGLLMRSGLSVIGGTTLFRLVEETRAGGELFEALARTGILTRRFADRPHWLRFGLPGDDASFERLAAALAEWRPQPLSAGAGGSPRSRSYSSKPSPATS